MKPAYSQHKEGVMSENEMVLAKLLELKEIVLDQFQHGNADQACYATLRRELLADTRLFSLLPAFLKQDMTLLEVRRRSQQLGGRAIRRAFVADASNPPSIICNSLR